MVVARIVRGNSALRCRLAWHGKTRCFIISHRQVHLEEHQPYHHSRYTNTWVFLGRCGAIHMANNNQPRAEYSFYTYINSIWSTNHGSVPNAQDCVSVSVWRSFEWTFLFITFWCGTVVPRFSRLHRISCFASYLEVCVCVCVLYTSRVEVYGTWLDVLLALACPFGGFLDFIYVWLYISM